MMGRVGPSAMLPRRAVSALHTRRAALLPLPIRMPPADLLVRLGPSTAAAGVAGGALVASPPMRRRPWPPLSRLSSVHSVPRRSEQSTTGNGTKSLSTCHWRDGYVPLTDPWLSTRRRTSCRASSAAKPIPTVPTSNHTTTRHARKEL